jgi:2-polyprenyl-3-methyl-5-hydroxy-6-metoxy-1,4-benzoquinol methylase
MNLSTMGTPTKNEIPTEKVACDLCGADAPKVVYRHGKAPGGKDWTYEDIVASSDRYGVFGEIVRCRSCGLYYASPRIRLDVLIEGYRDSEDAEYLDQSECRSMNAFMSLAVLRRFVPKGRLLEIGCSAGFFLNAARIWFEVHGIELSKWSADFARQQLKVAVDAETLERADYPSDHFDAVALVDVIEHVPSPKTVLKEVARVLKPGGAVYLVTPDMKSLTSRLMGRYWWALRPGHIFYFDAGTLKRTLEAAGFEVVHTSSYGRIFTLGYWYSRLNTYPAVLRVPVGWFVRIFGLETKFTFINTRDSIEVVARKK